jgi:CysZ protein
LLKEIIIAIQSYFEAHKFIRKHRLWKWILIPGIIYTILFIAGMYFFFHSSGQAVAWLSNQIGVQAWLQQQRNEFLNLLFVIAGIALQLILLLFYFSLFKYLFLIIGSPVFAYLSEKTESILAGKDFPFSFRQLMKDIVRGISLSLRNTLWQTVYVISLIILSLIPFFGMLAPVIALFVECYYYGFSMLDYSCERKRLSPAESIDFIGRHKGLAVGNGMIFYLMHAVIFVGWILAPAYAVIAATLSLYEVNLSPETSTRLEPNS